MLIIHTNDVLGIPRLPHSNYDFVNVRLSPDTKLFLDPCLIANSDDLWTQQANRTVESYFDRFYSLYREGLPEDQKLGLFWHAHEINATHLGYGNGSNGKAKTPYGMLFTFRNIPILIQQGVDLSKAPDLPVFIRGFSEDCMSDMLTNILLKDLMEFTLIQCKRYGVEVKEKTTKRLHYWDSDLSEWAEYTGPCLTYNGKLLLLVPKNIVRNRFFFNADHFFRSVILEHLKEESAWRDGNGKIQKLPKKVVRKNTQGADSIRDCISRLTKEKPAYLSEYHAKLPQFYSEKCMSDEDLDRIVYSRKIG